MLWLDVYSLCLHSLFSHCLLWEATSAIYSYCQFVFNENTLTGSRNFVMSGFWWNFLEVWNKQLEFGGDPGHDLVFTICDSYRQPRLRHENTGLRFERTHWVLLVTICYFGFPHMCNTSNASTASRWCLMCCVFMLCVRPKCCSHNISDMHWCIFTELGSSASWDRDELIRVGGRRSKVRTQHDQTMTFLE